MCLCLCMSVYIVYNSIFEPCIHRARHAYHLLIAVPYSFATPKWEGKKVPTKLGARATCRRRSLSSLPRSRYRNNFRPIGAMDLRTFANFSIPPEFRSPPPTKTPRTNHKKNPKQKHILHI